MGKKEVGGKTAVKRAPAETKADQNKEPIEKKKAPVKKAQAGSPADRKNGGKNPAATEEKAKNSETHKGGGPSESCNIVMPYVLATTGVLLGLLYGIIFIGKLASGASDGGFVGDLIMNLFSWLLGWAMYVLPAGLVIMAIRWRRITAAGKTHGGLWAQMFFVTVLFSAVFELLFGSLAMTWAEYGEALKIFDATLSTLPGGFVGGFIALAMRWALRQVFSAIVLCVVLLILLLFFIGLTPEKLFRFMKERHEYNRDRRAEYLKSVEEARRAEAEAAEIDRKMAEAMKEEEERKKREEEAIRRVREREDKRRADEAREEARRAAEYAARSAEGGEDGGEAPSEEKAPVPDPVRDAPIGEQTVPEKAAEPAPAAPAATEEKEAQTTAETPEEDDADDDTVMPEHCPSATEYNYDLDEESAKKARPKTKLKGDDELMGAFAGATNADASVADDSEDDGEELDGDEKAEGEVPESTADGIDTADQPEYVYPPVTLLTEGKAAADESVYIGEVEAKKAELAATLRSFGIRFRNIEFSRGPTITRYEIQPEPGQRVKAIQNLMDDIALNMAVSGVRFEPSISGKSAVGIEVPNTTPETVTLRSLVESETFLSESSKLTACLGADITGKPVVFDVSKMPHLLVAGATGMGKSVCINSIIVSLMYKATPEELRLILIDPKKVEFAVYRDMPHLLTPIITDPQKAAGALCSAVSEMERRFELIERVGVRDIKGYKKTTAGDPDMPRMPHIVIIIDELADLMMTASNDVEAAIMRIAQKARAAGIHLIIGTQRPSVDVITGTIKANIPSRIACTVASQTDSRTILDAQGAEKLCGRGDMLFAPVGASRPRRVQGSFVSDDEVARVVSYMIHNNGAASYDEQFMENINIEAERCASSKKASVEAAMVAEGGEDKFDEAVIIAIESGKIATSLLQRRLSIGYGRAAKIIDQMEKRGYVSAAEGTKPRKVLVTMDEYLADKEAAGSESEE